MATTAKQTRSETDEVIDLAETQENDPAAQGRETFDELREELDDAAGRTLLREVPYAAVGLGKVVADAARKVDPSAVTSKASELSTRAKVAYLALAARGRAAGGESAVDETTTEVADQAHNVADAAQSGVDEATAGADTAGGRAKAWLGRAKGATTRTSKKAKDATTRTSTKAKDASASTRTSGANDAEGLEDQTVAELRERASELDIEGRASMRKQELIESIRDAE